MYIFCRNILTFILHKINQRRRSNISKSFFTDMEKQLLKTAVTFCNTQTIVKKQQILKPQRIKCYENLRSVYNTKIKMDLRVTLPVLSYLVRN